MGKRKNINSEEVIKYYLDGVSVAELQKKYNCADSTIYNKLKTNEECIKKLKSRNRRIDKEEMIIFFCQ